MNEEQSQADTESRANNDAKEIPDANDLPIQPTPHQEKNSAYHQTMSPNHAA